MVVASEVAVLHIVPFWILAQVTLTAAYALSVAAAGTVSTISGNLLSMLVAMSLSVIS